MKRFILVIMVQMSTLFTMAVAESASVSWPESATFSPEDISRAIPFLNPSRDFPEELQGIWWMDGNPLADENISFSQANWLPKENVVVLKIYGAQTFVFHDDAEGSKLVNLARRLKAQYRIELNDDHTFAEVIPQVVIDAGMPIPKVIRISLPRLPDFHWKLGDGAVNPTTAVVISLPKSLARFTMSLDSDGHWVRQTWVKGDRKADYHLRRIVDRSGREEGAFSDYLDSLADAGITRLRVMQASETELLEEQKQSFTPVAQEMNRLNNGDDSTACEKLETMWQAIDATAQTPENILPPNSDFKDVLTFGNGSALRYWKIFEGFSAKDWAGEGADEQDDLGDEIRPYRPGSLRDTVRLTHRYGVNVKLGYVPLSGAHKLGLTGHYAKGNNCVLGRLSSAVPTSVEDRFTPALATKFFMDGAEESQVLIAQHDIGGQSWQKDENGEPIIDNNFYSKYLSNRLSFEKGAVSGVGAFSRFFYTAQYFSRNILGLDYVFDPRELQANHLGKKEVSGRDLPDGKGPRFIWLVAPSEKFREAFRKKAEQDSDFRRHFLAMNDSLELGKTPLYHVYGSDTWTYDPVSDAALIGKFVINSPFRVSEAADVRLYFKHAIQFHEIPDSVGGDNPYTKDYPFAKWTDDFFTHDCNLGARQKEVWPKDLVRHFGDESQLGQLDFSKGSLDGTFLRGATVDPRSMRFSDKGEWCFGKFLKDKIGNPFEKLFK